MDIDDTLFQFPAGNLPPIEISSLRTPHRPCLYDLLGKVRFIHHSFTTLNICVVDLSALNLSKTKTDGNMINDCNFLV